MKPITTSNQEQLEPIDINKLYQEMQDATIDKEESIGYVAIPNIGGFKVHKVPVDKLEQALRLVGVMLRVEKANMNNNPTGERR